jgi:hypothetical protein
MASKPSGILILVILQLISALWYVAVGGLAVVAAAGAGIFGIFFAFAGLIFLIVGIIGIILAWGLWNFKGWAWLWALIANFLALLGGLLDIANMTSWVGLALSAIIVIYLLMPSTKAHYR